jgi:hypothetical protein
MTFQQYPFKDGIPSGNTAGRPSNPVIGDTYYNGQLEILEIYNGTAWVAASAPPATPSIATPTDVSTGDAYTSTAGKLQVIFTPGSGGGTPSQYNAFTTVGGYFASSSSTTVTITGLTPGTSYTVYGNAQNNFGTTVNTANAAAVTPTTLPEVRTIGTATASPSANEVTVTWTNGNNGGKNLSAITITPFLNGTTAETSRTAATTSSTSYTFTEGQLTAGAAYTFKVKATNANGTSADSTASNSATMPDLIQVQYAIIAGGGGGGGGETNPAGDGGGGGGGGGQITNTINIAKGTYSIEVGSGGAGDTTRSSFGGGGNGNLSRIHQSGTTVYSLSTPGGGGGGGNDGPGLNGGCGGGASGDSATFGIGSPGFNGAGPSGGRGGGGGGGMSAAGTNQGGNTGGGNGGAGVTEPIKSIGVCGGGAGGRGSSTSQVGTGATSFGGGNNGANGTANTGGGGGAGQSGPNNGGSGGSGRIILKSLTQASATTGSPTVTTSGSYYIYDFTATGSITW